MGLLGGDFFEWLKGVSLVSVNIFMDLFFLLSGCVTNQLHFPLDNRSFQR